MDHIPDYIKYPGWEKSIDPTTGMSPFHYWAVKRFSRYIADIWDTDVTKYIDNLCNRDMLFEGCQIQRDITGKTPLMSLISKEDIDIDECVKYLDIYKDKILPPAANDITKSLYNIEVLYYPGW